MRLKNLFVVAVLILSGCASLGLFGLKPPPDVDSCALIWKGTLSESYAFCVSWSPKSNREYRVTAEDLFKKNYIAMSGRHESDMEKYVEYLEAQAKRRCK